MAYVDRHTRLIDVPADRAWHVVSRLGGERRFYAPELLWRLRGAGDRLLGGPGLRLTGPERPLRVGDAMDFWKVVDVDPPRSLRVRARSRLPGVADLVVEVAPTGAQTLLTVVTEFAPDGLLGHGYWWSTVLAHRATFALMTDRLVRMVTDGAGPGTS